MHVDGCRRPRLVLVVGERQHVTFDQIDVVPVEVGDLGVALHELPGGVNHRARAVGPRVPGTSRAATSATRLGARRARFGFLGKNRFDVAVIDHGCRKSVLPLLRTVDPCGQVGAELRLVGRLRHRGLHRERNRETIVPADEFDPFLGENTRPNGQDECRDNATSHSHDG